MERRRVARVVALLFVAGSLAACSGNKDTAQDVGTPSAAGDRGWTIVTPQQLSDMMSEEDVYLVNVHVPYEGEIPGTDAFIPYNDIASKLDRLPFDDQPVVIYCRSGVTSGIAAQVMAAAGAAPFYELQGGYTAWQAAGLPFTQAGPGGAP
jgi:rhodanese-related sulfurtransferase